VDELINALQSQVHWLVETIGALGLPGIFILMFIESSLVPFPSEIIMIPAGMKAAETGGSAVFMAIVAGTLGSLAGAYFNYYLAVFLGRRFILKYGRYVFLPPEKFERACVFFERHGAFGTFSCRLIPGIRQIISIPAGLARLSHAKFAFCTALGAGLWVSFLTIFGYYVGRNEEQAVALAKSWTPWILLAVALLAFAYWAWLRHRVPASPQP
jgi:membrane protein DedA with SNARE-associated domain